MRCMSKCPRLCGDDPTVVAMPVRGLVPPSLCGRDHSPALRTRSLTLVLPARAVLGSVSRTQCFVFPRCLPRQTASLEVRRAAVVQVPAMPWPSPAKSANTAKAGNVGLHRCPHEHAGAMTNRGAMHRRSVSTLDRDCHSFLGVRSALIAIEAESWPSKRRSIDPRGTPTAIQHGAKAVAWCLPASTGVIREDTGRVSPVVPASAGLRSHCDSAFAVDR